jgi:hypothetical protein
VVRSFSRCAQPRKHSPNYRFAGRTRKGWKTGGVGRKLAS